MTMPTSRVRPPSPADVAAAANARLVASGERELADPPFRQMWEHGIRTTPGMHRNTRLVGFTLGSHADWLTGEIAPEDQPGLAGLVAETQLIEVQVVMGLTNLISRGWVSRAGSGRYETVPLRLIIRAVMLPRLRTAVRRQP